MTDERTRYFKFWRKILTHSFQFCPPRAMPLGTKLLPHLPILVHSGGPKFHTVVAHGEIDVVDGVHEETVLVLCGGYEEIALDGVVGYEAAEHDAGFFICLA